ncbi:g1262 [Coccomyxa viridis]|uniref:G1262 protein n=1 Tax=Coccomyxa viridis TaxID=1274662 RepID=A0ABP1FMW1_9CHLO
MAANSASLAAKYFTLFSALTLLSRSWARGLLDDEGLSAPSPPVFPNSFEVSYNFSLPYEKTVQKDGLVYPVRVWRDAERGISRMDTFGGRNVLISTKDLEIDIIPRLEKLVCRLNEPEEDDVNLLQAPVLPDVSNWVFNGTYEMRGQQANLWVYEQSHGAKVTIYKLYATQDGQPLRLHMDGNDMFSGAHFDEYIADYNYMKPGAIDEDIFRVPDLCDGQKIHKLSHPPAFPLRMAALLPAVRIESGDALYDGFAADFGRRHASMHEYEHRRAVFHSNRQLIEAHNAAGRNFTLGINRFADWTEEEFLAVMLPRHGQEQGLTSHRESGGEVPYERLAPKGRLPTAVDWRGTGADNVVKDQATCGSCWAFGATAALQSAYWMATGKSERFSEQQLTDCSWKFGANHACDGGDYDNAIDYLVTMGGIAREDDYEYLGQDNFCKKEYMAYSDSHKSRLIKVKGYSYVPRHDDEALMEALYSRGTIAISLDASQPSFRFYASGTYDEPNCMHKAKDLDHAVAVVGYGTDDAGKDYWIVKNSWSSHWGDNGYINIARAHHACGVTTDPIYAVFEPSRHGAASAEPADTLEVA